jgi:Ca2+-transporting ATPase
MILHAGDKVSADGRLLDAEDLEVNEALLTGESAPVKKNAQETFFPRAPLANRRNMVYTGTVLEKGLAQAVVVSTAGNTELGHIAKLTTVVKEERTPLQERLVTLGKKLAFLVAVLATIIFIVGIFEEKTNLVETFTLAVAVAVAAIPEGLPAAMSIVLAVASQRISRRKGLVKTLIGAETLGSTNIICADKTGTLTEGVMKVESLYLTDDEEKSALILALANEADIESGGTVSGETTDKAKMEFFIERGGNLKESLNKYPRISILTFDAENKYIASFHSFFNGDVGIFVTGAPEKLLKLSVKTEEEKSIIIEKIEELAGRGFRLIGIAERVISKNSGLSQIDKKSLKNEVKELKFCGVAAIRDPIRPDVKESIETVRGAGIRVMMITGDHKLTAKAIGQELGFRTGESNVVSGAEIDIMNKDELRERVKEIDIISRANPVHKMKVVDALKENKYVVAMTGDGVNDAPALKEADIGVAVAAGTDVTKEAADLVLLNDSFSTIAAAVQQGRVAFDNIRKVTIFQIADGFTEVILVLASLILRVPFVAITAVQILWTNMVEDGLPTLSLAFEPEEKGTMKRKPFKRAEPIINKLGYYIIGLVGIVSDFVLVALFFWLVKFTGYEVEHIQTIMFAALGMDTLIFIFSIKTLNQSAFSRAAVNNKYLLGAVLIGFILMFAALYLPFMNVLLGTIPLGFFELSLAFGTGIFRFLFIETVKFFVRRNEFFHSKILSRPAVS